MQSNMIGGLGVLGTMNVGGWKRCFFPCRQRGSDAERGMGWKELRRVEGQEGDERGSVEKKEKEEESEEEFVAQQSNKNKRF